jgi:hypothetical protein
LVDLELIYAVWQSLDGQSTLFVSDEAAPILICLTEDMNKCPCAGASGINYFEV